MPTALHRALPENPHFAAVLTELQRFGRAHLLAYNLACGQLLLEHFWGGDPHAYSSKDSGKEMSFQRFVTECADLLADLGQTPDQLRRAIQAHLVWRGLPAGTRERLMLTHLLELSRCGDPTQRARLALAAADEHWTRLQLREAVSSALVGRWYDTDPETPGVQPPAPPEPPKSRTASAARLVSRSEKLLPVVREWQTALAASKLERLTTAQRERLVAALAGLETQIAAAKSLLGK